MPNGGNQGPPDDEPPKPKRVIIDHVRDYAPTSTPPVADTAHSDAVAVAAGLTPATVPDLLLS